MGDFNYKSSSEEALKDVTAGTVEAGKAVITDANNKIDTLDITAPKFNGVAITATATSGQILVGDGTNIKSVAIQGDASLASDGTLALEIPKIAVINKTCAIADFTDNEDATGYIDFAENSMPAGAIPLGWKAVVTEGFTGDTGAIIKVGTAGVPEGLSGNTSQTVLVPGIVGSNASCGTSSSYMGIAFTPRVTVVGDSDFSSITAGAMTVYIYYIATT
jgi:hypothetical protein